MGKQTRLNKQMRRAVLAMMALAPLVLVGCGPADGDVKGTVDALLATIAAQETVIATLESVGEEVILQPTATATAERHSTVELPTPRGVSTVLRPPTATPSPLPTATATATATSTPVPDASVGDVLTNLRSGPGIAYAIVSEVDAGTPLEVLGKSADGEWFRVRVGSGLEGWMFYLPIRLNIPSDTVPVVE